MIFTRIAQIIAWVLIVFGAVRTAIGFYIATWLTQDFAPIYLGTHSTGEAINQGMHWLLIGAALGTLTEISRAAVRRTQPPEGK